MDEDERPQGGFGLNRLISMSNALTRMELMMKVMETHSDEDRQQIKDEIAEVKKTVTGEITDIKNTIKDMRAENLKTLIVFERGRTAVYILGLLGTTLGFTMVFAKDFLLKWWFK